MSDSKLSSELYEIRQVLSKAQAEKARSETDLQQVQALQESVQRQLDEVTLQLKSEQLRASDLEAVVYKAQISAQVR